MPKIFGPALFLFCIFFPLAILASPPLAKNGTIDLSDWDFARQGSIKLSGQWHFCWQKQIAPRHIITNQSILSDCAIVSVPQIWNDYAYEPQNPTSHGYATYILKITGLAKKNRHRLALSLKDALTAYSLFFITCNNTSEDCKELRCRENRLEINQYNKLQFPEHYQSKIMSPLMKNGIFGQNATSSVPQHLPLVRQLDDFSNLDFIVVHISNFHDNHAGMIYAIEIGTQQQLLKKRENKRAMDFTIIGILLIMAIYHFLLFLQRRKDKPSLFFSLFSAIIGLRMLMTEKYAHEWFPIPNEMIFELLMKIDYATFYLAVPIFFNFICHLFQQGQWKKTKSFLWIVAGGYCFGLIWGQSVYAHFLIYYQIITILLLLVIIAILVKAVRKRTEGAKSSVIGFSILALASANDMLHVANIINSAYISPYGFIAFIIVHVSIIAQRFAHAHATAEHLSHNLKKEVMRQTQELRRKNEILEKVDKQKTVFFQNISHDLRTPLTLIHVPLQGMLDGEHGTLSPNIKKVLRIMQKNTRHLLRLINQFLDLSKIESGIIKLSTKPIDLNHFLNHIAQSFITFAQKKGIELIVPDKQQSIICQIDTEKMEKVFYNLITNAFKHCKKEDRICIRTQKSHDKAQIFLEDTGSGIPDHELPFIFERFYQAGQNSNTQSAGSGIGLSIVKNFIDIHGGSITVKSAANSGTLFLITLPLSAKEHQAQEIRIVEEISDLYQMQEEVDQVDLHSNKHQNNDSSLRKILVIDDNEDIQLYIQHILSQNYQILLANNGKDGISKISQHKPDIIITDLMMPEMDGLTMIQHIKSNTAWNKIPILLLTAHTDWQKQQEDTILLPDATLAKPFKAPQLRQVVAKMISQL